MTDINTAKTIKTFAKRFNAQRAAKAAIGKDAAEGVDFTTAKDANGEWAWSKIEKIVTPIEAAPTTREVMNKIRKARKVAGDPLTPPDFSAKTHERYRPKLAAVVAMVEARDVDGLRKFHINPNSTSPRAIMRYRDRAIEALTA
jgi:hypothetical protein